MPFFDFLKDTVSQNVIGAGVDADKQFPSEWNKEQMPTGLLFSVLSQRQFSATRQRGGVFGGSVGQEYRANFLLPAVDMGENVNHQYSQESLTLIAEILAGTDDIMGAISGGMARAVQQSGAGTDLTRARGQLADTQSVSIYTGSDTRSKTFSWTLLPESAADVQSCVAIMKAIKKWASPEIADRRVTIPPSWAVQELFLDEETQRTRYLPAFRFGPANVSSYSFNLSGDKMWTLFKNGDPIRFEISITLTEVYINSRGDIERYGL